MFGTTTFPCDCKIALDCKCELLRNLQGSVQIRAEQRVALLIISSDGSSDRCQARREERRSLDRNWERLPAALGNWESYLLDSDGACTKWELALNVRSAITFT